MPSTPLQGDALLCYCRPGFEPELAAELTERAAEAGFPGYARTERDSAVVQFFGDGAELDRALPWNELIFARQKLIRLAELKGIDTRDRVGAIQDALIQQAAGDKPLRFGELVCEPPDSDAGKPLAGLARALGNALRPALRSQGLLSPKDNPTAPRLHVLLLDGDHLLLAAGETDDSAPWPMGIIRLRMHAEAPSRSALKLEEALLTLLTAPERERWLKPDMRAADLGAAPGGWSWVLVRNGLHVTAIDNGPLRENLMDSGRVDHLRADGFQWQPRAPLDWMVCDMVEQPRRVAERMAAWFREGWCRHAVFNLKLPMRKRWDETRLCLGLFQEQAQRPLLVRARQLYHDREEITVFASTAGAAPK